MTDQRFCGQCDKMVPKVGVHSCVRKAPAAASPHKAEATVSNVTNVVNNVTNKAMAEMSPAPFMNVGDRYLKRLEADRKRAARWRAANPDRYRGYMRDLMRRWREAKAIESAKAG